MSLYCPSSPYFLLTQLLSSDQTYAGVMVSILIPMKRFFTDLTSERDSS